MSHLVLYVREDLTLSGAFKLLELGGVNSGVVIIYICSHLSVTPSL